MKAIATKYLAYFMLGVYWLFTTPAHAQWTSDPQVNTRVRDVAGVQEQVPLTTPGPNGGLWVAWFETAASTNYQARLQLLDAAGNPQLGAAGLLVSNKPQATALYRYDLEADSQGNAILAFQDTRSGSSQVVVYKVSSTGQQLWGADGIQLLDATTTQGLSPTIGFTAQGNVVIGWNAAATADATHGTKLVPLVKLSPAGTFLWTTPVRIQGPARRFSRPALAPVPGTDDVVVEYVEETGTGLGVSTVFAQRYNTSGAAVWNAPTQVSTKTIPFAFFPEPVPDGGGSYFVQLNTGNPANASINDVYVQRVAPDGTLPWGNTGAEVLAGASTQRTSGSLQYVASRGELWSAVNVTDLSQGQSGVSVQRLSAATGSVQLGTSGSTVLAPSSDYYTVQAFRSTGTGLLLAYSQNTGALNRVLWATKLTYSAQPAFASPVALSSVASSKYNYQSAYLPQGLVTVWQDQRTDDGIYAQIITDNGQLGTTPTLTSISPTSATAGTSVTLTGTNLTGATAVSFNGTAASSFVVNSATSITATVPAGATSGPVTVTVTTPSGPSNGVAFTVVTVPTITSFSPTSGPIGTSVTITGTGFNPVAGQNVVFFGATQATVTAASPTSLTVSVPLGTTYQYPSVTNLASARTAYASQPFLVTLSGAVAFQPTVDFATGSSAVAVSIGDLDGDGKPDLAVANNGDNTVSVFRNTATAGSLTAASFAPKVDFATGASPSSVSIADVDGDGKLDLVVANANNVSVLRNTATAGSLSAASFAPKVDFATNIGTFSVGIGDLDGDGKPDIITANNSSSTVSVLRNTATAGGLSATSFAPKVDFATGAGPYSVSVGDVDGDGKPDIVTANFNDNSVSVLRNTATAGGLSATSFAPKVDFATDARPYSVSIGDLDGDGKPDLVTANRFSATVSVLRNTTTAGGLSASSFAAHVEAATDLGPNSVAIGDVDGDGKPDLAVAILGRSTVSVFRNTATAGSLSAANFARTDFATASGPSSVSIGDLDGDGKPDLVTANNNSSSSSVSVLRQVALPAAPVVTAPANGSLLNTPTPTYSGTTVAGSTVTVYVDNVSIGTAAVSGTAWTLASTTPLSDGSHTVKATATDAGGNVSAFSATNTFTIDTARPTATLSTTASSPTSTAPIPFSVTFSEAVTSLAASGIAVTNGTVTGSMVSGSGSGPYTFTVTPTGSGTVTVSVLANAVQDAAGNGNTASNAVNVTYAAPATTLTWNGSQSQDWNTAANWTPNQVPTASTDALIPSTGVRFYPIVPATGAATRNLTIQAAPANAFSLTQSAGTLSVNGNLTSSGTINKSAGTIAVTGDLSNTGTLTQSAGDFTVGGSLSNNGTITQSAGTIAVTSNLTNNGTFTTGAGTVLLGGGATASNILGSSAIRFWNLNIQAGGAQLSISAGASVRSVLALNGNFATNGNVFTLESASTGTALVVNNGSNVVTGNTTVQRYIDPSLNSGPGYRHYSAPVSSSTVADLATFTGFSPVVNPAYNSAPNPGSVAPFPNVFGYDESRVVSVQSSYSAFDRGYYSPAALSDPLTPGRGYTVNIGASQLVDFVGALNNGPVPLTLTSNRASNADAGWHLVGNPYPAPLDYRLVAAADRLNLEGAIYVFSSTSQYGGQYRAYTNNVGNPYIPLGQGFFARVATGFTSGTLVFRNSQRLTVPNATTFQRPAETRPLVQLTLQGTGSPLSDDAYVYFEQGATDGLDPQYDAVKMSNTSGLNLSTSTAGQQFSIDGRGVLGTASRVVPLAVGVPTPGSYTLTTTQLLNLSSVPVYLRDRQSGALIDLAQQPTYTFTVASASAPLTGRFELVFSPQRPLATVPAALAEQVGLYPNPAKNQVAIELPAGLSRQPVTATLVDAVGRVVREQQLPAGLARHTLSLTDLATGVYAVRLRTELGTIVRKLVVE